MLKSNVAESFFLTKNNYEDSTKNIFKTLLKDVEFSDVTLALNDENQVKGHKAILGASSSFFRKIFQQNSDANLVLYLKGINSKDMNSIMEFIYLGQTSVNKVELNTFLEAAEELKIEGLLQPNKASMSAGNSSHVFQTVPEITIGDEESPDDDYSSGNISSEHQSTLDTSSSQGSLSSSMLDTTVSSPDVSSEMMIQVTPDFISTMLPLPVSMEDQEVAARIVANIKKNTTSTRMEENTGILNGSITFDCEKKHYSCSRCVFTSVHRRSSLRHFANTHADSDKPDIKQEKNGELEQPKQELSEESFPALGSFKESTFTSEKIKKHECSHCDFSTAHSSSFKRHLYLVHRQEECKPHTRENTNTGPKKYSCTNCNFATDHFYSLRRHMDNIHTQTSIQDDSANTETAGHQFSSSTENLPVA